MRMVRLFAIAVIVAAAACGNSTSYGNPPPPPSPPPPPPPGGHATTIDVANNSFSPTPDTVSAGTITFHWAANAITHNVTWTSGPTTPTASGNRAAGDPDYAPTVQAGTYTYHCTIHAAVGMSGTLVVTP